MPRKYKSREVPNLGAVINNLLIISECCPILKPKAKVRFWYCQCRQCLESVIKCTADVNRRKYGCSCSIGSPGTHNETKTPIYQIRRHMIERCHKPNNKSYKDYGARGITVCDDWLESYENFKIWALSSGYKKGLGIERKNNNKGYSPENCEFITMEMQSRNRRTSIIVLDPNTGLLLPLYTAARLAGIPNSTVRNKLDRGISVQEALIKVARKC